MTRGSERILVSSDGWASALKAAKRDPRHETGGILLGCRQPDGLYVAQVIEVPDNQAHHASYRRRHREAQTALGHVIEGLPVDTPLGYVGEWHTHPAPVGPSCTDRCELKRFSRRAGGQIGMIVLAHDPRTGHWTPCGLCALDGRLTQAQVQIEEVSDGESDDP